MTVLLAPYYYTSIRILPFIMYLWIDCQMTGLDPDKDRIIQFACVLTDLQLNQVAEGPQAVLHAEQSQLQKMGQWCRETHQSSGLWQKCLQSKVTIKQIEQKVLDFLQEKCKGLKLYLAGNSIHMDRLFLRRQMKLLIDRLQYRILDVSSIKLIAIHNFQLTHHKKACHRALEDIRESIAELQFYLKQIFK